MPNTSIVSNRLVHPRSLDRVRREAKALSDRRGINGAARLLDWNSGRLHHIVNGRWKQVVVTDIDAAQIRIALEVARHDDMLNEEARELAQQFERELSQLNGTAKRLIRALRQLK